jgi:N-acetylglucosamine-6-sulfatase
MAFKGESRTFTGRLALVGAAVVLSLALTLALAGNADRAAPAAARAKPQPPPPNIVVIETDDQTQESVRVMPNVRSLIGDHGATFPRSFVNYSLCCPSRSTLLTGEYAHNHGVLDNVPPNGGYDKLDSTRTLPLWLQGAGYYTGLIGKYLNGYEAHRDEVPPPIPPGYSEWQGSMVTYTYYGYKLNENGVLVQYGSLNANPDNPSNPGNYQTDVYTRKAVDFINRRAPSSQPYFLWLTYLAPHSGDPNPSDPDPPSLCDSSAKPAPRHLHAFDSEPLPQPPSFNEADVSDKPGGIQAKPLLSSTDISDIGRFYRCRLASLLAEDEGVAQIIAALRATGELDNTLVVFTSDNGFMHGEHRVKTGKVVLYEESIRVPLMIRGPGFPKGKKVRDLVVNADLAKTILRAAGARAGVRLDGMALQGFAENPDRERGRELMIESNTFDAVRTERYIYADHFAGESAGQQELYDLDRDPFQLHNLAGSPARADVRSALAKRLGALRNCSGDGCRRLPHLRLALQRRRGKGGCALRPVVALVDGADRSKVVLAEFYVNGNRFALDHRRPFERKLPYRKLHRKHASKVKVRATLLDGRRLTEEKRVRACR